MSILRARAPSRGMNGFGDVAGETWPTTGEINTETASLALSISSLGRDIFNSETPDSPDYFALENGWNTFVADFGQWKDAGWFWNPGRRDELVAFRARFNALLDKWKALGNGAVITVAGPVAGATAPPSTLDKAADIARSLVWVVGIGGALWVGITLYREAKTLRRIAP